MIPIYRLVVGLLVVGVATGLALLPRPPDVDEQGPRPSGWSFKPEGRGWPIGGGIPSAGPDLGTRRYSVLEGSALHIGLGEDWAALGLSGEVSLDMGSFGALDGRFELAPAELPQRLREAGVTTLELTGGSMAAWGAVPAVAFDDHVQVQMDGDGGRLRGWMPVRLSRTGGRLLIHKGVPTDLVWESSTDAPLFADGNPQAALGLILEPL